MEVKVIARLLPHAFAIPVVPVHFDSGISMTCVSSYSSHG